jgi:hypothetical protein
MKNRAIKPGRILHNVMISGFSSGSVSAGASPRTRVAVYTVQGFSLRLLPLPRFNGAMLDADINHRVMMKTRIPFRAKSDSESVIYRQGGRISND